MLFFDLLLRRLPFIAIALLYMPSSLCAPPRQAAGVSEDVVLEFQKRNGLVFDEWQKPELLLVITGQLDGYIEPCGCSGKENQKGGLSRRQNFLRAVASAQWPVLSIDLGNQVKRFGRQTEIKFQSIADGLRQMGYAAVGFGPGDLRLPAEELVAAVAPVGDQPTPFVSANVGLLGLDANITPRFRVIESKWCCGRLYDCPW
jgi:5''-nucleotidase/2'',3''-cyclic phosphodiesterase and related esterases